MNRIGRQLNKTMKQNRRTFLGSVGIASSIGIVSKISSVVRTNTDSSNPNEKMKDLNIINNGQEEHQVRVTVTKQNKPEEIKINEVLTVGGKNEPGGPSNPVQATIQKFNFVGGDTYAINIAIDGEYQGAGYVVTNSDGVGPFVGVEVNINPVEKVRVETTA